MKVFGRQISSPISSPASFRALYERSRLPVFRYIYGLTGGPQDDVEDLTAETFLRAWKARHRFNGDPDSATGWLIRIAKRLVIDAHRRNSVEARHIQSAAGDGINADSPELAAITDEQNQTLKQLLLDLPEEQREILVLRYMLGWKVNAIAAHLGLTENNVSVTIHRTLGKLWEQWPDTNSEFLQTVSVCEEKIE
jgi:RNA polymerase sigma-70 factor, ECF subfamily